MVDIIMNRNIGETFMQETFVMEIVKKLDIIKNSKYTKTTKQEKVESIISDYYDKHGARCHFFLQKRLLEYVTNKHFVLGEINEVLGKQMRKCGCDINNKIM